MAGTRRKQPQRKNKKTYKKRLPRQSRKARATQDLKRYQNEDGTRIETSIEKKIRKFLEKNNIPFTPEKFIEYHGKWKCYDFLITDGLNFTFFIEADGDYYHCTEYHEGKIAFSKLSKVQKKNYYNDKRKNFIAKKLGIPLLRFNEKQIKNGFQQVSESIFDEIYRQTRNKWKTDKRTEGKIQARLGEID